MPHALGRCHGSKYNNHTLRTTLHHIPKHKYETNHDAFTKYRYVLAMENTNTDFYLTEKIFLALRGGAIPIHWGGGETTAKIFHPDVYIPINDPMGSLAEVFSRILAIESDPAEYERATLTPILLHGEDTIAKYFPVNTAPTHTGHHEDTLKQHILKVLESKLPANKTSSSSADRLL